MSGRPRLGMEEGRRDVDGHAGPFVSDMFSATPRAVLQRRESAAAARRRRNALTDVLIGVAVGLLVWLLGFGLAPLGLLAFVVLVLCARSYRSARRRRRRRRVQAAPR
ncbi:MAG: hypothetical protein ACYDA6_10095 [Solirubrobacteraceae bacterium]